MALQRDYKFFSYDAFPNSNVKISSVLKAMQQLAREDLDNVGVTYPLMRKDNLAFVLIKLRVKFNEPVSIYDNIIIKTIPTQIVGIYFFRDFFFYNADDGRLVGQASSSWVLLNFELRRPVRPTALKYEITHCNDVMAECPLTRNISCDGSPLGTDVRKVLLSDMDENNHLNNAIIADFVTDSLENEIVSGKNVKDIEIHFHKEARLSEQLEISKFCVESAEADGKLYEVCAKFAGTNDISFLSRVEFF